MFGGIQNQSKKYSANIERLRFDVNNVGGSHWELLNLKPACQALLSNITARQGAGMTQLSEHELLIVGGFNGKFLTDGFIIDCEKESATPKNVRRESTNGLTLFPF